MRLFSQLVAEIQEWGRKTHGATGPRVMGLARHLYNEGYEVLDAVKSGAPGEIVGEELADNFILSCALADAYGVDLEAAVERKMAINRTRSWEKNPDGTITHKK